jgi:hypothetical protein
MNPLAFHSPRSDLECARDAATVVRVDSARQIRPAGGGRSAAASAAVT